MELFDLPLLCICLEGFDNGLVTKPSIGTRGDVAFVFGCIYKPTSADEMDYDYL